MNLKEILRHLKSLYPNMINHFTSKSRLRFFVTVVISFVVAM